MPLKRSNSSLDNDALPPAKVQRVDNEPELLFKEVHVYTDEELDDTARWKPFNDKVGTELRDWLDEDDFDKCKRGDPLDINAYTALLLVLKNQSKNVFGRSYTRREFKDLIAKQVACLHDPVRTALASNSFQRISQIRITSMSASSSFSSTASQFRVFEDPKNQWVAPFIGNDDLFLLDVINDMDQKRSSLVRRNLKTDKTGKDQSPNDTHHYMNQVSIIQSSGSGKSRLVDQVAQRIFTIPINLRDPKESETHLAYPPQDDDIRTLLVKYDSPLEEEHAIYFIIILTQLVATAPRHLVRMPQPVLKGTSLAKRWHSYLGINSDARAQFFKDVVKAVHKRKKALSRTSREQVEVEAEVAYDSLLKVMQKIDPVAAAAPGVKVLFYFDEAHELAKRTNPPTDPTQKLPLDLLASALNCFIRRPVFAIFLSTQSNVSILAPSQHYARSGRVSKRAHKLPAPYTETIFDCFDGQIDSERMMPDQPSDIVFMSILGRPMWRSVTQDWATDVLEQVLDGDNHAMAEFLQGHERDVYGNKLLDLARTKLLHNQNIYADLKSYSAEARTAVVDVRLMLSYEPSRIAAQEREMTMIASHMRTVYSISEGREVIRAGYPSEPILAEAAARQLHTWTSTSHQNPMLEILSENLKHDLLARGEMGEVVGRLLLMTARDAAVIKNASDDPSTVHFSRPVSVVSFIQHLFPEQIANNYLNCAPDNMSSKYGLTFKDAFKDAVIAFTHFQKAGDDSSFSRDAALGAFLRGSAIICRNNAPLVDVILPVVRDRSKPLTVSNMTCIMVQFKNRQTGQSPSTYVIDEEKLNYFATHGDSDSDTSNTDTDDVIPYMTFVMELGIIQPPSEIAKVYTKDNSKGARYQRSSAIDKKSLGTHGSKAKWKPHAVVHQPGKRLSHSARNARYSITVYGCSPKVYRVIKDHERTGYKRLLAAGDLFAEHPRQIVPAIRRLRRFQSQLLRGFDTYRYFKNKYLSVD